MSEFSWRLLAINVLLVILGGTFYYNQPYAFRVAAAGFAVLTFWLLAHLLRDIVTDINLAFNKLVDKFNTGSNDEKSFYEWDLDPAWAPEGCCEFCHQPLTDEECNDGYNLCQCCDDEFNQQLNDCGRKFEQLG